MLYILAVVSVTAYLIGSLPLAKWAAYGLTFRGKLLGARYDALVRVCTDIAKGAGAVFLGHEAGFSGAQLAAFLVFFGHIYPLHGGFGRQNGMGTLLGALIFLDPLVGLTALSSWMFAYYVYRHPGSAAVISAALTAFICGFMTQSTPIDTELLLLMTAVVFWRHRQLIFVRK
ncbi:MAG: glycerol-3-phosphate acyltransferase [Litoreibacter sp.]